MKTKFLIIDGSNALFRNYYANNLHDKDGKHIGATFGTMRMVSSLVRKFDPQHVIITWDWGRCQERLKIYPEYKAQRQQRMEPERRKEVYAQVDQCQALLDLLPVRQVKVKYVEADDIIGYLCEKLPGSKTIISGDTDFLQLVNSDTRLFLPNKDKVVTTENVEAHIGFPAKYYALWKSMTGDSSDNISGLGGVGPVRATKLIKVRIAGGPKLKLTDEQQKILERNKYLITIGKLLTDEQKKKIRRRNNKEREKLTVDLKKLKNEFVRLGFRSLLSSYNEFIMPFERVIRKAKKK